MSAEKGAAELPCNAGCVSQGYPEEWCVAHGRGCDQAGCGLYGQHQHAEPGPVERIAHRYAEPFLAACGARPPMTTAPDEAKVNCPDCKAIPSDPAAFAAHDQLAAAIREALAAVGEDTP